MPEIAGRPAAWPSVRGDIRWASKELNLGRSFAAALGGLAGVEPDGEKTEVGEGEGVVRLGGRLPAEGKSDSVTEPM